MNMDGLRDRIIELMAGIRQEIDPQGFVNDMVTFGNSDDVLTLLVHLGYLSFDEDTNEVFIPTKEIIMNFQTAIERIEVFMVN